MTLPKRGARALAAVQSCDGSVAGPVVVVVVVAAAGAVGAVLLDSVGSMVSRLSVTYCFVCLSSESVQDMASAAVIVIVVVGVVVGVAAADVCAVLVTQEKLVHGSPAPTTSEQHCSVQTLGEAFEP